MASFFSYLRAKKLPNKSEVSEVIFGPLSWHSVLLSATIVAAVIVFYIILVQINDKFLVTVPAPGGTITEGVIGAPHFINPLLAATATDTSLTELVYAGLVTYEPTGATKPELASSYSISPDGRSYTFTLEDDLFFHDGTALTSADVLFTLGKLQDPFINTSDASYWQSVLFDAPDKRTVTIRIPAPNPYFLERMTIGILPKHLWEEIPSDAFADSALNLSPVGAGPFKVVMVKKENGVPSALSLVRNRDYVLGKPLLSELDIAVYANQATLASAVRSGAVQSTAALDPETVTATKFSSSVQIEKVPTERTITLYRAKNEIVLSHVPLVTILNRYIDKEAILDTVEGSNGLSSTDNTHSSREEVAEALKAAGYTQNPDGTYAKGKIPLGFSIAVENTPRLLLAARNLANQLNSLGMIVSIQAFDPGVVLDEVAAARFPVLLTDELPPASYMPVVELYKETVPYVARAQVHIDTPAVLSRSVLRFSNAHTWYTKTDRVWKWLVKSNK